MRDGASWSILIPSSFTEEAADPRIATYKVGQVGRAASVFGVDEIVVYHDEAANDARFIETVLRYQECPPYLRRRLFAQMPELAHAGLLPPLRTPLHATRPVPSVGEVRAGVVVREGVDVGLARPARGPVPGSPGERVTVRIAAVEKGEVLVAPYEGTDVYLGYVVRRAASLREALGGYDVKVATSRDGEPAARLSTLPRSGRLAIAFGSPSTGLEKMLSREGTGASVFDAFVNTLPDQRTETVRAEEAILVTLGILNAIRAGL
ncbi:MAG: putative RNA uridine N3 methyltransferase [Methanobacteriota archaeon]